MYRITYRNTIGFFLVIAGILGVLDRYFDIDYQNTWPIILIALGAYILFLPRIQSRTKPLLTKQLVEIPTIAAYNLTDDVKQTKAEHLSDKTLKVLFISLYGVFVATATITHIWTVVIAFTEGGFLGGTLSLFLPFLAELYWMFKMFGENDTYAYIALIHLLLAILYSLLR